ncbi:UDP-glucose:protein N-beta-glucosyltransferase [Moraxella nasicaprae]|uniref:Adhesin n=1 Tax=Moraxella nasicaprae TaxID=2904122 RepID=A0ABY6F3W9_9GAMM|nr:hypothetical protein [Moraxella nasicaprae]UXZ04782.1 hypothetical protein LU297_09510 [Moraxella nasicaprae]
MSEPQTMPSVLYFETLVAEKKYEEACGELLNILIKLDANFGNLQGIKIDYPESLTNLPNEQTVYFCTRMAVAITQLFTDPELIISQSGAVRILAHQRWISLIFASSPYVNADHILQTYNINPDKSDKNNFILDNKQSTLIKFCILYLPESEISISLDALWAVDKNLCASLCFALQSPRFIGTDAAFSKRAAILQWLPNKLKEIDSLANLPSNITHDVYMHCSYDTAKNKHDVKKGVNALIRSYLVTHLNWQDRNVNSIGRINGKPVMVVVLEHFNSIHSIYRTHSTSMIAAREHFYIIGIGSEYVDALGREVFDEFHKLPDSNQGVISKLQAIRDVCDKVQPAILYMPSIGMDLTTIFASNTRLAPIQAVALGHPGTTHSEFIEYVIVEDDYVGLEECFSEELIRLPKDALPYVPSALAPTKVDYKLRENPEVVNIGIASTTMKLNPYFLNALRVIRDTAKVKIHYHFALGQSMGVTHPYVERFIKSYLGDSATAHPHSPYQDYLITLHNCDLLVNPFPFGNTNGIIDMVTLGLVGVCKTGDEVHEHIDEGLFKRLGLPEWLIANTVDEYVQRVIRLAENHEERLALRRQIIDNNGLQTLFSGDPSPMGRAFVEKLHAWADKNGVDVSDIKLPAKKSTRKKTADTKTADTPKKKVGRPKKVATDEAPKKKVGRPKKTDA